MEGGKEGGSKERRKEKDHYHCCLFICSIFAAPCWNVSSTHGSMGPLHASAPPTFVQCQSKCISPPSSHHVAPHKNGPLCLSADLFVHHTEFSLDAQVFSLLPTSHLLPKRTAPLPLPKAHSSSHFVLAISSCQLHPCRHSHGAVPQEAGSREPACHINPDWSFLYGWCPCPAWCLAHSRHVGECVFNIQVNN